MFENDYALTGIHATYLKFLAVKNSKDDPETEVKSSAKIFERYIDVYMNAAIWGLLYGRVAKKDTSSDDRARIYADAFNRERDNCIFLYRMVMILDKTTDLSTEDRINRAFRYDSQPEKIEEFHNNMELFNAYIRGGLEIMFEQFTDGCITRDDYLNKTYQIISTFKKEIEGISYEDELKKLIK